MSYWELRNRLAFEKTIAIHNAIVNYSILNGMINITFGIVLLKQYFDETDPEYLKKLPIEDNKAFLEGLGMIKNDSQIILQGFKEYNEDIGIIQKKIKDTRCEEFINKNENFFLNGEKALHARNCQELNIAIDNVKKFVNYDVKKTDDNFQYIIHEGLMDYISEIQNLPPYEWDLKVMSDIWVERSYRSFNDSKIDMILKELLKDLKGVIRIYSPVIEN